MCSMAASESRAAALIYVDLNGMKRINDEQGHDAGDDCCADRHGPRTDCRPFSIGRGARIGGDEFEYPVDFTPQTSPICALAARAVRYRSGAVRTTIRLSMSRGAAFMSSGAKESLGQLLERADSAMYEAKQARKSNGGMTIAPKASG